MIKFLPSLGFAGNANEAIELYTKAFGAEVKEKVLFSEADPKDFKCKDEEKDFVFYCELIIGKQIFAIADDSMDVLNKKAQENSYKLSLLLYLETDEDLNKAYEVLSDGAKMIAPIHNGTYFTAYTIFEDKFGICWQLMSGYSDYHNL